MSEKAFQQKWNAVNDYKMCEPEYSEGSEDSEDYS
jgi:predicted transcriptional regulator